MSDTDDTDILLLIPPNFFLVSNSSDSSFLESPRTVVHKPPSCSSQVLGKLVSQVRTLESRLESLEISGTSSENSVAFRHKTCDFSESFDERSSDRKCFTFPRKKRKKFCARRQKNRKHSITSFDSISIDKQDVSLISKTNEIVSTDIIFTDLNESHSMDGDLSSIVSSPSKKNDKLLLNEIDEFLSKVEAYESPDSKCKPPESSLSPVNVIRATGDYISQKFEGNIPGNQSTNAVLNKYIYLADGNGALKDSRPQLSEYRRKDEDSKISQQPTQISEETRMSLENRSPIVRKLSFIDKNKDVQQTSTPKKVPWPTQPQTFKPTSNKVYDRASKILEQYKTTSSRSNDNTIDTNSLLCMKREQLKPFNRTNDDKIKPNDQYKYLDTIDTDLLSLSDLWGEKGTKLDSGKLEEERLKREHLETMIQELQKRLLEQQQRIAVAIKVDRAKDSALNRLKEAWLKVTNSLEQADARHRTEMDNAMREVERYQNVAEESQKKTQHFESELYKALDIAHDYQEKCKALTSEKDEIAKKQEQLLQEKDCIIKHREDDIELLKDNYDTLLKLNKQATDCIKNLENSLEMEKSEHDVTKSHLNDSLKKIQNISNELSLVLQERDILKDKINEERSRNCILDKQLSDKMSYLSSFQQKEDVLENEIDSLKRHLEVQKNELKSHYQRQLEEAVLNKLQEFQKQLEQAENDLQRSGQEREQAVVDMFNKQIGKIEDQHKLEISVLEEKQREEVKLYRLQLAQSAEKISLLQSKVEAYRGRRGELAQQLHGVMQNQWRQALHILTRHPAASTPAPTPDHAFDSSSVPQEYLPPKMPPLTMPLFAEQALNSKMRLSQEKIPNFDGLSDSELQEYVKVVLSKPPFHLDSSTDYAPHDDEPTSDKAEPRKSKRMNQKPPWKS